MSMEINRRHLLRAAPAVGFAALVAGAAPVEAKSWPERFAALSEADQATVLGTMDRLEAATETPVAALFREWSALEARICDSDDLTEELLEQHYEQRRVLEDRMLTLKAATAIDVLKKVCALTVFGVYSEGDIGLSGVWDDAKELVGA